MQSIKGWRVCNVCVSTCVSASFASLQPEGVLPSPDGAAFFVLPLNSSCHGRPPTQRERAKSPPDNHCCCFSSVFFACRRPSRHHSRYLSAAAVLRHSARRPRVFIFRHGSAQPTEHEIVVLMCICETVTVLFFLFVFCLCGFTHAHAFAR